jgi:hypothetical protein
MTFETEAETQDTSCPGPGRPRVNARTSGYADSSDDEQPKHHAQDVTNFSVTDNLEGGGRRAAVSREGAPAPQIARAPLEYSCCGPSACADREKHPITNALLDCARINGVRFSVSKVFWAGYPFYEQLEERVFGTFNQWLSVSARRPKITWDDGGTDDDAPCS